MKQYFGMSQTGNLKEAAQGVHAPGLLILMSNADQFEAHVTELESLFPGVPEHWLYRHELQYQGRRKGSRSGCFL